MSPYRNAAPSEHCLCFEIASNDPPGMWVARCPDHGWEIHLEPRDPRRWARGAARLLARLTLFVCGKKGDE